MKSCTNKHSSRGTHTKTHRDGGATRGELARWLITSAGSLCFSSCTWDESKVRLWNKMYPWRNEVEFQVGRNNVNHTGQRAQTQELCVNTWTNTVSDKRAGIHQCQASSHPSWRPPSISSSLCAIDTTSIFIWKERGGQAGEFASGGKKKVEEKWVESEDEGVTVGKRWREAWTGGSSRKLLEKGEGLIREGS